MQHQNYGCQTSTLPNQPSLFFYLEYTGIKLKILTDLINFYQIFKNKYGLESICHPSRRKRIDQYNLTWQQGGHPLHIMPLV